METDRVGSCTCVVHMHSPVPQWERGQTGQRIDSSCGPSYLVLLNAAARPADSLHRACCWTEAEAAFLQHTEETELGHSRFLFCICVCVLWSKPNQSQPQILSDSFYIMWTKFCSLCRSLIEWKQICDIKNCTEGQILLLPVKHMVCSNHVALRDHQILHKFLKFLKAKGVGGGGFSPVRMPAILLRRALVSSWLSCRCSLVFPVAGDRSGLLSFLNSRGGGAGSSCWNRD